MYRLLKFKNFKSFLDYSVSLKDMNVLIGPNNAGKSSVLDAFRSLSGALKFAYRRNPTPIEIKGEEVWGYIIPQSSIPISLANVHTDYNEDDAQLLFTHANGNRLKLVLSAHKQCFLIPEKFQRAIRNTTQFKTAFPGEVACFPTLGPVEEEEHLLSEEYVQQSMQTRRSHRMFRNIWYYNKDRFEDFRALVSKTWPSMSIESPKLARGHPPTIDMFCKEGGKYRELSWAGFGFQVWLQTLTHLIFAVDSSTLIVDEPEIYLHPDLQHRLFEMLRASGRQVMLATHSVEIINAAEHDELALIDSKKKTAHRIDDIDGVQNALTTITLTNEREKVTEHVTTRSAWLIYCCWEEDRRKDLARLYELRSRFIHGDKSPQDLSNNQDVYLLSELTRKLIISAVRFFADCSLKNTNVTRVELKKAYDDHCPIEKAFA
jgi:energy-coupling factor transporter ATP-binding protein EcfA2